MLEKLDTLGGFLLAALIAGTFALIACLNTDWLTYRLWGVLILFGGYMKFQTAWDFFRLGHQRWWWILIGTAISFLFGILIAAGGLALMYPGTLTDVIGCGVVVAIGVIEWLSRKKKMAEP